MESSDVKCAIVVGAGVMGHSIAQVFAQAGIDVGLVDVSDSVLKHALDLIRGNLETLAKLGKIPGDDITAIVRRIHPTTDLAAAASDADFALETVVEVPEVKRDVFSRLEEACSDDVVLASNTSGLEIFDILEPRKPARIVAAHWFAPPHIIPLVEIAPGPETAPDALDLTAGLMRRLGKRPIVMKQFVRAFIVNRIQNNISLAVWDLLQNGWATPEEIDLAVKLSLGVRLPIVGVVQTLDFTGLDLVNQMMQNFGMVNPIISEKVANDHLGAKSSKGIYDYGGRSEQEILSKRDELYLRMIDHLDSATGFEPV